MVSSLILRRPKSVRLHAHSLLGRDPAQPNGALPSPPPRPALPGLSPPFNPGPGPFDSMGGGRPPFPPGGVRPPVNVGMGGGPQGFGSPMPGPHGSMQIANGGPPGPPMPGGTAPSGLSYSMLYALPRS